MFYLGWVRTLCCVFWCCLMFTYFKPHNTHMVHDKESCSSVMMCCIAQWRLWFASSYRFEATGRLDFFIDCFFFLCVYSLFILCCNRTIPAINNHRKYSSYFLERMCGEGLEENLQKMCYRGAYLTSLCMKGGR